MSASQNANHHRHSLLGYLTYVDLPMLGTVGGFLIVDLKARPVEFHCSSPVLPTRTQEILYGQTLRQSVVCDQIGKSLLSQVKQLPQLLLTDEPLVLELQESISSPIVAIMERPDGAGQCVLDSHEITLGQNRARIASDSRFSPTQVRDTWGSRIGGWDGLEPLERIREAISEAHRAAA